jgi:hypothetical protein
MAHQEPLLQMFSPLLGRATKRYISTTSAPQQQIALHLHNMCQVINHKYLMNILIL